MSSPITKTEITGFRGAIRAFELEFDHRKDFTMLFGENGSGKSTILDAIDVVCNQTVGCLEGVSVGQSPGKFLCALGCQPSSLRVAVHSNGDRWTGSMSRNAINVAGPDLRPRVKILRRNRILELVMAQPSERYRALSRFIEIDVVERSESTLQQKRNETNQTIDRLVADKDRMSNQLENLWEAEGRPGPEQAAYNWAESKITTGISNLNDKLTQLNAVVNSIIAVEEAGENYNTRSQSHSDRSQELADINQQIESSPSVSSATTVQLLESLEKAKKYIEAEQALDKCPTCQRLIDRGELLITVSQEFGELSELKKLTDNRQTIQGGVNTAASHLQEATTRLIDALKTLESISNTHDIPEITALNISWPSWDDGVENIDELVAICELIKTVRDVLEQQRDATQRDVNQFNSINEWWTGINNANNMINDLNRILSGLRRAYDIIHERRVAFTQNILDGIRDEANRLFQAIHPGENIGLEELKMEEQRRGSVSQTGTFNGHSDIPPQAVFSESHLDTLGFCVWLALAKRESPEQTILLIDDIFSSVDATHLGRVIDLLSAEASNFLQIIVATHYRLWWDRCQNAQGVQRIHLGRWDSANGIAAQNMPLVTQQLCQLVSQPVLDRQAVSSKAGILLESILDDMALLYGCSLPRNKLNEYTLGALLSGCSKLFSRHNLTVQVNTNWNAEGQSDDWQALDAKSAYDRVNAMQFTRNQVGCHFNAPGMEIPDNDVRDFGEATIELLKALTCPNCGMLAAKKANDGTHLRCSCTKRAVRMTPVAIQ